MENGQYVDGSLWFYAPNKSAPVVFAIPFAVSMLVHIYQCIQYKCWKVTGLLPWAALLFVTGYILREIGSFHYGNLDIFISSIVMLYAAPPLYELANYLLLSRILYYIPYHAPLPPTRVLTTFGFLSSLVEALNGNGAAYSANSSLPPHKQAIGRILLKTALCLQLAILFIFLIVTITFHRRCRTNSLLPTNLRSVLTTLYISSALISIRTIYRTIEYFTSASINYSSPSFDPNTISPVLRYEWFFYVFEATLMLLNTIMLNVRHPMRYLPRDNKVYLARDGMEVRGMGYEDQRRWWITLVDPFDVVGLVRSWRKRSEGEVVQEETGGAVTTGKNETTLIPA